MLVVPAGWVRHAAERLGAESRAVVDALRLSGLQRRVLGDDSESVGCAAFAEFLDHAARLAGDDLLGFNLGLNYDLRAAGLAGYVAIASGTVAEAMQNAVRYGALRDTSAVYALETVGGSTHFRIDSRSAHLRASRQVAEFKVALVLGACQRWAGAAFRPTEVRFAHARAVSVRAIERRLNCPARFGSDVTEVLLTDEQLALPLRGADPHLLALLRRHADEAVAAAARARRTDLRSRVERALVELLPRGTPTLLSVANRLGIGERTLARRLTEEGASFRQITDELRLDMARGYLADPELSLSQITYLLGYAEQSAFTNAFRRWTGQSPHRWRRSPPER